MTRMITLNEPSWLIAGLLSGLVGTSTAHSFYDYRHDMKVIRGRLATGSRLAQTERGQIEFATWGSGPPVLIVHGAAGGYDQGKMIAYLLGENLFNIAVSRFGYLRSPLPDDASHQAQADLFAALLDHLSLDKVVILGASAGGPSAIHFASRYADRCAALLLVSAISSRYPIAYLDLPRGVRLILHSDYMSWLLLRLGYFHMAPFFGLRREFWDRLSVQDKDWMKRYWFSLLPLSLRRLGIHNDLRTLPTLPPLPLDQIAVPTLIIHAVDDTTVPISHAYYAAEAIPGAQMMLLPAGGHLLIGHHQAAESVAATFLKDIF